MCSAGAAISEIELAEFDRASWTAVNTILVSEGAVIYSDLVARYPDRTSDHLKRLVESGSAQSATDYLRAKAMQEDWRERLFAELPGFDALLTLPAFGEAPRGLDSTGDAEYCAPWTFLGGPALTLPVAFGPNRLPLSLQLVASYRNDHRLLRAAKWIETTLAFDPGHPGIGA